MARYLLNRLLTTIPVIFIVLMLTFTLGFYAPGDPIVLIYNENLSNMTPEDLERLRNQYGLNRPYWEQYVDYMGKVLRGDLGVSIATKLPVTQMIRQALPISVTLGLAAGAVLILLGIPLGVLAAMRHNSWVDYTIVGTSMVFRTIPVFVLGPMLMIVLILQLKLLDVPLGWKGLFHQQTILPIALLAAAPLADVIRQTRVAVLEVLSHDYVRTAQAKGLKTWVIITSHVLRNALLPVVTSLGLIVNALIHGSVFIDRIFTLGGFGEVVINSIKLLDIPVILGTTIFSTLLVIVANLLVDLVYPFIDPRVRL
ncbi:MAG: ABC transporter permease [Anaerolineae bacterium]|nr:ABC transporter permease [Anaerolineae bacterium]